MISNPALPMTHSLADRSDAPTPENAVTRYDIFVGYVAAGLPFDEAALKARVNSATIETMVRRNDGGVERRRLADARLAGYKTKLSVLAMQHFFDLITEGQTVKEAMVAAFGSKQPQIYALLNEDPDMADQFRRAQEAAMHGEMDEIKAIADDTSRDVISGPKGDIPNNAAVGRDKLRTDARFRRAGVLNRRVYGEERQAAVNVNLNFAEILEKAERREQGLPAKISKEQMDKAIEATFTESAPAEDASWLDEKPKDPIWREES